MIEQQMELDGSFGSPEFGPGKDFGAPVDHAAVQTQKLSGKAQRVPAGAGKLAAKMLIQR